LYLNYVGPHPNNTNEQYSTILYSTNKNQNGNSFLRNKYYVLFTPKNAQNTIRYGTHPSLDTTNARNTTQRLISIQGKQTQCAQCPNTMRTMPPDSITKPTLALQSQHSHYKTNKHNAHNALTRLTRLARLARLAQCVRCEQCPKTPSTPSTPSTPNTMRTMRTMHNTIRYGLH